LAELASTDSLPQLIVCNSTSVGRGCIGSLPQLVGFDKALCRAYYLFEIRAYHHCFNIDKNIYKGTLMTFP